MNTGTWTLSLSTTSKDWNNLSATFASNIGPDNQTVFSGNLAQSWSFPKTMTITLTTPFLYDPSKGNLLMDVITQIVAHAEPTELMNPTNRSFHDPAIGPDDKTLCQIRSLDDLNVDLT